MPITKKQKGDAYKMSVKLIVDLDDKFDERFRKTIVKKFNGVPRKGCIKICVIEALEDWIKKNE